MWPLPVSPGGVVVSNSANNYVFGGPGGIGGFSLTKEGAGALTLATAESYTGNTTISAGTLILGAATAVPGGSGFGNVTVNGTLDVGGYDQTVNNFSGGGTVDNVTSGGSPVLTVSSSAASTLRARFRTPPAFWG